MLGRRGRTWVIAAAVIAVAVAVILLALPFVVRALAIRRVEAMTGRPVAIGDVDLNLFTRRIVFTGVRIASPGDALPLAEAPRVEARFRLAPLVRGRVYLDRVVVVTPVVRLARQPGGALSAEDVIDHWRAHPAGDPVRATLQQLSVQGGEITFADRAVEPMREWGLRDLAVEARDIRTVADAPAGRLSATFTVAGAAGELHVERLRVRPFQARASVQLDALDVAPFSAYSPAGAPIQLAGGQVSLRLSVEYDARGFVRANGESAWRDLVIARAGQTPAFITVPLLQLRARDVTYTGGNVSVAGLALSADQATVLDAFAPRARPVEVRDIRFTFDDARVPGAGPGRISLTAGLPGNGTLEARGTGEILSPASDLSVEMRGLDVALAQLWLPLDTALTPVRGEIGATMSLRYAGARGLTLGGRAWITDLEVARQSASMLLDDRVEITVADFTVDDGVRLGRLRLAASPTIVVGVTSPPLHLPDVTVSAAGGDVPGSEPTRIEARIALPHGGRVTATGEARLGARTAALSVTAADLDMTLAGRYMPAEAPVVIERGRLDARLSVAWTDGLDADGSVTMRGLTVRRSGQSTPLVEHARLQADLTDLAVRAGTIALSRVTVTGSPTIVDASASPPQRFELRRLALTATDVTWPARHAMRLEGHAEVADGGTATLRGSLHPQTLATDARLAFEGVDVTRARGYIPASTPLTVESGRAQGTVWLRHARAAGTRIDGEGAIRDLALTLTVGPAARVVDDRATFSVENLLVSGGTVAVDAAVIEGSPRVGRGDDLAPPFDLRAALARFTWPTGPPADLTLTARPGGGRVEIRGTFAADTRSVQATMRAESASTEPFAALLPIDAPVGGRLDARIQASVQPGAPPTVSGTFTVGDLRVGPEDTAPVRVETLRVEEFALEGDQLDVARITLTRPRVLIEREKDGAFPLRAVLTPDAAGAAAPRAVSAETPPATRSREPRTWRLSVDELRVVDGAVRFLDRTTQPFYSEEVTKLEVTVHDLTTRGDRTAGLTIHGIVGVDAALNLRGEIAPFASPFYLEVSGELRDFAVPRTNPYLQRFLDWIARRGQLTTKVHYRIVGDELHATNELFVHRLDVEPARGGERAERLVGLPLGLVVALLKDATGDIHFTLPVTGELGSPKFSFGDAIRSALSNVLGRLVSAPFRAIGSVFQRDGAVEDLEIDPLTFAPGSAALAPEAASHLQRVADFLRARPYVRLALEPVVTERDLEALRAQEVTARIQRVQREQRLEDFGTAARRVWSLSLPAGPAPPDDPQEIVTALAAREPAPVEAARRLAERRESVARTQLVDAAGIPRERLVTDPGKPMVGAEGEGRVEFLLAPAS